MQDLILPRFPDIDFVSDNIVDKLPMFRALVHRGGLVLVGTAKECV